MTLFWIAMYAGLFVFNGFCAWLALLGFRPFRHRWQLVAWHFCLMVETAGAALFINAAYGQEIYRLILRLAWLGALIVGLTIMAGWIRLGFRANDNQES